MPDAPTPPPDPEAHRLALSDAAARISAALDQLAPINALAILHTRGALHVIGARASLGHALDDVRATLAEAQRAERAGWPR